MNGLIEGLLMRHLGTAAVLLVVVAAFIAYSFGQNDDSPRKPIGDGKSDATAALQAMVDRGGLVALSKGIYRITKTIRIDLSKTGFVSIKGDTVARVVV